MGDAVKVKAKQMASRTSARVQPHKELLFRMPGWMPGGSGAAKAAESQNRG